MKEYEIKNAVIEKADITTGERGFLDAWLSLNFGGTGQGFGGFALYLPKSYSHHSILSVAGHHIFRIMEIAEVEKWSQLPGKTIRVEGSWTEIKRIGHIVKDDWYSPQNDFAEARDILANAEVRDGGGEA
jgi:hypothetical protein